MTEVIDLRSPAFQADKYGEIERLRAQNWYAPVKGGHVFFNQDEAIWILKCEDFRFDFFQIDRQASPYLAACIEHELLNMHAEPHGRLQKIVLKALRDQVVEGLQKRIGEIVNALIDAFPDDGEVEFCTAFANPFPAQVLGPMFAIPYAEIEGFDEWIRIGGRKVDALQSGDGIEAVEQAVRNMHGYLGTMLADRRAAPGEDVFSELIQAEVDGDRLTDTELLSLAGELASAGVDTTRSQLPLILEQLLKHPDQMALLREEPDRAMAAVEEGMRIAPLPWALPHRALRDVTHKGLTVKQGDLAMVMIPAVNRDPEKWDRPDEFDIMRPRQRNFSFGYGMHACPGSHLARMEMSLALTGLIDRLERIDLISVPKRDPVQKGETPVEMKLRVRKRT